MSAQAAPEGLSVMAAVLTTHQFAQGDGGCSCEGMFYDTRRTPAQIMHEHVLHVEMELLNARIGPVAEARAQALEEAAAGLHGWYDERMSEVHAPDVVLTDHEQGREVGITEGILAAALKIKADDSDAAAPGPESRARARVERRRRRRESRPTPATSEDEPSTYPPDPHWGTDERGRFHYVDYDGESLVIWRDKDGAFWVDKKGEGPVFVRDQDLPVIAERFAADPGATEDNEQEVRA